MRRAVVFLLWLLTSLGLAGCAGYRLGPTAGFDAGSRSVRVLPFANNTLEPRLPEAVVQALREVLQEDGTYRVSTRGAADVILTGTFLKYERSGINYDPNDVRTTEDFELRLTARVVARPAGGGKPLFDREVSGRAIVRVQGDQPGAELRTLPLLAEDLARNISFLLVDGDW
jgi:hypothetical protein